MSYHREILSNLLIGCDALLNSLRLKLDKVNIKGALIYIND